MPETKKDAKAEAARSMPAEASVPAAGASEATGKAEAAVTTTKTEAAKTEVMAYIGPTISRVAVSGSVYKAGLPRKLEEKLKEIPAMGELIVPVSKLGASRKQVRDKASSLAAVYRFVEQQAMTR